MNRKLVAALTIVLVGMIGLSCRVQGVEASGTVYIRADGSIDPPTAPISTVDNITYTLTDNINDSIVVERDSIVVDGAGYTLQGTGSDTGITLEYRSNASVKNIHITNFDYGIWLLQSSNNTIVGNNITANEFYGIELQSSSNNNVVENNSIENSVCLYNSSFNTISRNNMINSGVGLDDSSDNNTISGNNMMPGSVWVFGSSYNIIHGNNITLGEGLDNVGVSLGGSNNIVYENNITNNWGGIQIQYLSHSNIISENNITNNEYGIGGGSGFDVYSYNYTISRNNITNNKYDGISLYHTENTIVWGNTIANNGELGVNLVGMGQSSNNIFYHNNFINNTNHVDTWEEATWDNGYPSGGNYWDNYTGVDANNDGIGDMPHDISAWGYNNVDRYPLMVQYVIPEFPSFLILPLFFIATLLAVTVYRRKHPQD